jgi:hypothetical protein
MLVPLTTVESQLMMVPVKRDIQIGPADVPQVHTMIADEVAALVAGGAAVVSMIDIVQALQRKSS